MIHLMMVELNPVREMEIQLKGAKSAHYVRIVGDHVEIFESKAQFKKGIRKQRLPIYAYCGHLDYATMGARRDKSGFYVSTGECDRTHYSFDPKTGKLKVWTN